MIKNYINKLTELKKMNICAKKFMSPWYLLSKFALKISRSKDVKGKNNALLCRFGTIFKCQQEKYFWTSQFLVTCNFRQKIILVLVIIDLRY